MNFSLADEDKEENEEKSKNSKNAHCKYDQY
jgi:hypothetical protein